MVITVEDSNCANSDRNCLCHNKHLNTQATACVTESCTVREALSTKNLTSTSCGISPTVDHSYVPVLMAFTVIAAVCVLLRVIARLKTRFPVWWDDLIVALSFVSHAFRFQSVLVRRTLTRVLSMLIAGLRCIYGSDMVKYVCRYFSSFHVSKFSQMQLR